MISEILVSSTKREELIDITGKLQELVQKNNVQEGTLTAFALHATAAITVIENYDPQICDDFTDFLAKAIPQGKWRHDQVDGNGDAHIKAAIIGPCETFIIKNGNIQLGTWQSIVVCDFDGPRQSRKILVTITS